MAISKIVTLWFLFKVEAELSFSLSIAKAEVMFGKRFCVIFILNLVLHKMCFDLLL